MITTDQVDQFMAGLNSDRKNNAVKSVQRFVRSVRESVADSTEAPPVIVAYLKLSPRCVELFNILADKDQQAFNVQFAVVDALSLIVEYAPLSARGAASHVSRLMLRSHTRNLYKLMSAEDTIIPMAALRFIKAVLTFAARGGAGASSLLRELAHKLDFSHRAFQSLPQRLFLKKNAHHNAVMGTEEKTQLSDEDMPDNRAARSSGSDSDEGLQKNEEEGDAAISNPAKLRRLWQSVIISCWDADDTELTAVVLKSRGLLTVLPIILISRLILNSPIRCC
jgi:hypothetical protein